MINPNKATLFISIGALIIGIGVPIWVTFKSYLPSDANSIIFYIIFSLVMIMLLGAFLVFFTKKNIYHKLISLIWLAAGVAVTFAFFGKAGLRNALSNLPEPKEFVFDTSIIMPLVLIIIILPIVIWLLYFWWKTFFLREKILKQGIAGKAKVLKQTYSGTRINNQPLLRLILEVDIPNREKYTISKTFLVPQMNLHQVTKGAIVPVKVDQNNPKNVFLDNWTGEETEENIHVDYNES